VSDPPKTPDSWNAVAAAYRDYWSPRFQPFIDDALAVFEPTPDGALVVPGCGPGLEAVAIAQRFPGRDVIASDPAPNMVALLEREERPESLTCTQGRADQVSEISTSVAGIFSSFSFQLLPDHNAVLTDWARCLGPNATAVVLFWPRQAEGSPWRKLGAAVETETQSWRSDWQPAVRAALPTLGLRLVREESLSHTIRYGSSEEAWQHLVDAGSLQSLKMRLSAEALARCRSAWLADHGLIQEGDEWVHSPQASLWVLQRTVTHAEFLETADIASLKALYTARGVDTAGPKQKWLEQAQQDWQRAAMARARRVTEKPERLEPVRTERGGVQFAIYGVWHGLIGGRDKEYKDFVDATFATLDHTVFENGLQRMYPKKKYAIISDYSVLGVLGAIRIGLEVGFIFPVLIYELLSEIFKFGGSKSADAYDYSPLFHAVDAETRRGLENWPPLPSRLQIDYEFSEWTRRGAFATWAAPYAIAPRSMFMAGFACGYAEANGLESINLVVGDLHLVEIQRFLEDPTLDHALFQRGVARGRRGSARVLPFDKIVHLSIAAVAGCLILVPAIYAIMFAITYLSGASIHIGR
jgi:SAM-dependent methyltransferase